MGATETCDRSLLTQEEGCTDHPFTACCCAGLLLVQGGVLLQLSSLLAAYQARNVTTVYNNHYPVWQVGMRKEAEQCSQA